MSSARLHGFTLIELITVIILLSIISLSASSYFSGVSSLSTQTLQTELLRSLRLTQIRAMNRNGYCNRWLIDKQRAQQVSLEQPSEACSTAFPTTQTNNAYLENEDTSYVAILSNQQASFSLVANVTNIDLSTPYAFDFDGLGRIAQCRTAKCEITITGQSQEKICIEKEGYIHAC
ncbi:prepilin-type N-terminal cleavage/methylation domain-containing protein [Aliivibrio wodanis]|uniref:prepilin-type N-terminal cleavage/methylation domain-containing protein n=1 Tax=Aliivibrio wodanis TaxID=80852 RepID=UPI00406C729E